MMRSRCERSAHHRAQRRSVAICDAMQSFRGSHLGRSCPLSWPKLGNPSARRESLPFYPRVCFAPCPPSTCYTTKPVGASRRNALVPTSSCWRAGTGRRSRFSSGAFTPGASSLQCCVAWSIDCFCRRVMDARQGAKDTPRGNCSKRFSARTCDVSCQTVCRRARQCPRPPDSCRDE
jgi:hypothetical protein